MLLMLILLLLLMLIMVLMLRLNVDVDADIVTLAVAPAVPHFGAYHRPSDGHFYFSFAVFCFVLFYGVLNTKNL